jgi:hypothetical protein
MLDNELRSDVEKKRKRMNVVGARMIAMAMWERK